MKTNILLVAASLTAAMCLFVFRRFDRSPTPARVQYQGPTIERLEQLRHLATTRVYVADVLVGEGDGHRGAWLIRGDALIGVDLGRASIFDKDEVARHAVIRLPTPEVLQSRVDHERTRTWEVRRTTWVPWSGDQDRLRDEVMREAQRLVAHAAASGENTVRAEQAVEAVIQAFYQEVDWQVRVVWSDRRSPETATAPL